MTVCFFNYRRLGRLTGQSQFKNFDPVDQTLDYFFKQHQTELTVVGLACHDCAPDVYQIISDRLSLYCKKYSKKLIIVADSFYQGSDIDWSTDQVYFVDYWALLTVRHAASRQQQYNADQSQALCLTGTMDRLNRIGILAGLFKRKKLNQIRYSWLMPDHKINPEAINNCVEICKKFNVDYDQLENHAVNFAVNELDQAVLVADKSYKIYKFKEHQFNLALTHWNNTKFSLINETVFEHRDNFSVTEKTWMAVYNQHPFFVINHPGVNRWLNQQGIHTIDQLVDQDFDLMPLDIHKIDRAVDITVDLLDNNCYNSLLTDLVAKNFSIMQDKCKQSQFTICDLATQINVDPTDILNHLLEPWAQEKNWQHTNVKSSDQQWVDFYNNIRDPSWPDCYTKKDFDSLPNWIQQEILTHHREF